jgi:hypothetical protein
MDARHDGPPERRMSAIGFNRDSRGIDIALTQINNFSRCDLQMRLLADTNYFYNATIPAHYKSYPGALRLRF